MTKNNPTTKQQQQQIVLKTGTYNKYLETLVWGPQFETRRKSNPASMYQKIHPVPSLDKCESCTRKGTGRKITHQTSIYCVGLKYPSTFKHCNNTDSYCVSLTSILFTMASFCVDTECQLQSVRTYHGLQSRLGQQEHGLGAVYNTTHMKGSTTQKNTTAFTVNGTASTVKTWWQQKAGRGDETSMCRNKYKIGGFGFPARTVLKIFSIQLTKRNI